MDLIIKNAKLPDGTEREIGIAGGKIAGMASSLPENGSKTIDIGGNLVLPAFVNGHLHVAKSFWRRPLARQAEEVRTLPRFEAARHVKRAYAVEEVAGRVEEAVRLAIVNGTCALRLFVDVDEAAGTRALEAVLRVRDKFRDVIFIQVAAFPQDGVFNGKGTEGLMRRAMEMGADLIGGIPWIEETEKARREHVEMCFRLAGHYAADLHFVSDDTEDPNCRTLEYIASKTTELGWEGRVCATQCNALAFYDDAYAAKVIAAVKRAKITIFHNAHVSLITTRITGQPAPRGCTRVKELLAAGVPVAAAQDDIDDWFYPFGRNDMLEVAHYMASVAQLAWPHQIGEVLKMVTSVPAKAMGLENYGLEVGKDADLVVLEAPDWPHAVQFQAVKTHVFKKGRLLAAAERKERLFLDL